MEVNLDAYAGPPTDPETLRARREALVHQLGWLAEEADALRPLLAALPAWALEGAPLPEERSVKETFGHLVALDRTVYPEWLRRLDAVAEPALDPAPPPGPDPEANARPLDDLLAELRAARAGLVAAIEAVPEEGWSRSATLGGEPVTLFDLALRIVRYDADRLRDLAYLLHEANLSNRR